MAAGTCQEADCDYSQETNRKKADTAAGKHVMPKAH